MDANSQNSQGGQLVWTLGQLEMCPLCQGPLEELKALDGQLKAYTSLPEMQGTLQALFRAREWQVSACSWACWLLETWLASAHCREQQGPTPLRAWSMPCATSACKQEAAGPHTPQGVWCSPDCLGVVQCGTIGSLHVELQAVLSIREIKAVPLGLQKLVKDLVY